MWSVPGSPRAAGCRLAPLLFFCWLSLPIGQVNPGVRVIQITATPSEKLRSTGLLVGATETRTGTILLLDRGAPGIFITNTRLKPLGTAGRRGSGPGELREPVGIGILQEGRVAVLDRALRRINLYHLDSLGVSLTTAGSIPIASSAESMCVLPGSRFLIYGYRDGYRLHLFDLSGKLVRSFGPVEADLSPIARDLLTKGLLACDGRGDEVVLSNKFLPVVEAFDLSTGERMWVDTLQPFRPLKVEDKGGRVSIASGRTGYSASSSVLVLGKYRIFQTFFDSRRDSVQVDSVTTYIFDRTARQWLPPQHDIPTLLHLGDRKVVSVADDDEATIRLLEVALPESRDVPRP